MNKSPEKNSVTSLETAIEHVRDIVSMFRRRGAKTEHAIPDVATILGLTPARTKSLFYRDGVWRLAEKEAEKIERRFVAHLDREISLTLEYAETLRAKRDQIILGLACKNQNYSRPISGCSSHGQRSHSAA